MDHTTRRPVAPVPVGHPVASVPVGHPVASIPPMFLAPMLAVLLVVLPALLVGCSSSSSGSDGAPDASAESEAGPLDLPAAVVVVNSPQTLSTSGDQRVMVALIGDGPNAYLGGPDRPLSLRLTPTPGPGGATTPGEGGEVEGTWVSTDAAPLGLYVATFSFPTAGVWEVAAVEGARQLGSQLVEVVERPAVPDLGQPAPRSVTPTAATDDELSAISSDLEPDPAFYRLTVAEAVANGRPTVVAFVTPAFCRTALCGPAMDRVKAATAGRVGLDVVHVEPFDLVDAQAGTLTPVEAIAEWALPTEPWVFVVDGDGVITARFEGIFGQAELAAALDRL